MRLMKQTKQRQMRTRKHAERTERDFRWLFRALIGRAGFKTCARRIVLALTLLHLPTEWSKIICESLILESNKRDRTV